MKRQQVHLRLAEEDYGVIKKVAEEKGLTISKVIELAVQTFVVTQKVQEMKQERKQKVWMPPFMRDDWKPGNW